MKAASNLKESQEAIYSKQARRDVERFSEVREVSHNHIRSKMFSIK
jgi:hypothetical protein